MSVRCDVQSSRAEGLADDIRTLTYSLPTVSNDAQANALS